MDAKQGWHATEWPFFPEETSSVLRSCAIPQHVKTRKRDNVRKPPLNRHLDYRSSHPQRHPQLLVTPSTDCDGHPSTLTA